MGAWFYFRLVLMALNMHIVLTGVNSTQVACSALVVTFFAFATGVTVQKHYPLE